MKIGSRVVIAVSCKQILPDKSVSDIRGRFGTVVGKTATGIDVRIDNGDRESFTDKPMWFHDSEVIEVVA